MPDIHACFDGRIPDFPTQVTANGIAGSMNSDKYFTNLLHGDGEGTQDVPPPSQDAAAAKGSQGRSKNFRDEDTLLVSAWLNVSMDALKGADQPSGTYWQRIHAYFHHYKTFESDRSQSSLMNRWGGILHDVNVFCGCVKRIEDRNQSGCTVDDKIANACALYKAEDSKHRNFAYMHCWRILKDKPKWMERRKNLADAKVPSNKKQKTVANSSPASAPTAGVGGVGDAENLDKPTRRPDGKKKEKQKLRQRATVEAMDYLMDKMKESDVDKELKKDERWNKALGMQEEKMKLEREKFEFKRWMEEERVLTLDLSTLSDNMKQFYEGRQNEILARRNGC